MTDTAATVENLTTTDLLDAMYGSIQELIERGKPDNVAFHYFLPPIPFGPELTAFMELGRMPKALDSEDGEDGPRFTVNDMMRSAVNLAVMADYLPTTSDDVTNIAAEGDGVPTVDLNALVSSGRTISSVYNAVLQTCKVIDNTPTEEEKARLKEVRSELFKDPPESGDDDEDHARQLQRPTYPQGSATCDVWPGCRLSQDDPADREWARRSNQQYSRAKLLLRRLPHRIRDRPGYPGSPVD